MKYLRYGEDGIRVVFGDTIDLEVNEKVRRFYFFVKSLELREIIDITPSFCSCLICFNNMAISFKDLTSLLLKKTVDIESVALPMPVTHEIPVIYGEENGPDMEFISAYSGLTKDEIIKIHTATVYTVFSIGFMPGFPYLGTLDKRLYAPRLETPRVRVPKGSVGLAQLQTGIYTFESPGGWRIIGKTETTLFDYRKKPYSVLGIGDKVRFINIC